MNGVCYSVVASTFPWTKETQQTVGIYETIELAINVKAVITGFHKAIVSGGVKVAIIECPIIEDLVGRIRSVLDFDELAYLNGLTFVEGEDTFATIGAV